MGYTHYLRQPKAFTDDQWKAFVKDVKKIFKNTDIPIGNACGDLDSKPIINDSLVSFNGIGDDSYETCVVTKRADTFSFCKTAQNPYDPVVVAVYKAARKHNPSITLSSDGGKEIFG